MAERAAASVSSPQSSALLPGSDTPSSQAPRETPHPSDIFRSPGVASTVSSPPGTGASSKSREEQLGKVRDNLLAAEKAIEKLRQQAAKAISVRAQFRCNVLLSDILQATLVLGVACSHRHCKPSTHLIFLPRPRPHGTLNTRSECRPHRRRPPEINRQRESRSCKEAGLRVKKGRCR